MLARHADGRVPVKARGVGITITELSSIA